MVEKRFYHYYFKGIEEAIIIFSTDKKSARVILDNSSLPAEYVGKEIIAETTSYPITGVTRRVINGVKVVWAGHGNGKDGWIEDK